MTESGLLTDYHYIDFDIDNEIVQLIYNKSIKLNVRKLNQEASAPALCKKDEPQYTNLRQKECIHKPIEVAVSKI